MFGQLGYRYKSKFIELKASKSKLFIQTTKENASIRKSELEVLARKKSMASFVQMAKNRFIVFDVKYASKKEDYVSNIYNTKNNDFIIVLPRIVLHFKQKIVIDKVLKEFQGRIVLEEIKDNTALLKCLTNNSNDVLQLVKILDTRKGIVWCEPEMFLNYKSTNPLYPQQYYLKNTGQNGGTIGVDINIEPAWNITNGNSDIVVAVLDSGVDRNHEDMGSRVLTGYTIGNTSGEGLPQNINSINSKSHGMACAGIIGASNNGIGLKGIANNVKILPVNIVPNFAYYSYGRKVEGFGTSIQIAEAIKWAGNRADILSCSWGGGEESNAIESAINYVRTNGRSGLGCVVVFASGNAYPHIGNVAFPAKVDGVITVGAINNKGNIWGYSQRGSSMDLVAPSGGIPGDVITIDRMGGLGVNSTNYRNDFNGTSAACPQVAGVAALMLSVNPNLTEIEVRTILQNTARDLGTAGFDNTYGYGLVDAYEAVKKVLELSAFITGSNTICNQETYHIENAPNTPFTWQISSNLQIVGSSTGSSVTVKKIGNGSGYIKAIYDGIELKKYVSVGVPNISFTIRGL